jgi:hypothetical protein
MEFTVFSALVEAIQKILGIAETLSQAEERRRERVAAWLNHLSEVIGDIADKIELGQYPHEMCAQMEIMVMHFPKLVDGLIEEDQLNSLMDSLVASTKIEQLFGELHELGKQEKDEKLIILLNASGKLAGLATIVKHMD